MRRQKPAQNAHLLEVNSAFSPVSSLPDDLSRRFLKPRQITQLQRALLSLSLALTLHGAVAATDARPAVEIYGPPGCLACMEWAYYLEQNGFATKFQATADMAALKRQLKVPAEAASVLTARVGPYFVEGHVPAEDIQQLLREKPRARGLAVPGLPLGAPGYEGSDPTCEAGCTVLAPNENREVQREMFNTLLVAPDGKTSVYARH
jgi:hypothetical protein